MLKDYYLLTKPGIVYGNSITAIAGFLLASKNNVDPLLLVQTLIGISFVIASGCVFNNYIDRKIDKKMERTKMRPLVTGAITPAKALLFGGVLGLSGFLLLLNINILTAMVVLLGFVFYVVLYGLAKRGSEYGVFVGSVSGAVPPVVGYTAVTGQLDLGALLLFLILVAWQMPHFYAISIYKMEEYRNASIPVLPLIKGINKTKKSMLSYVAVFVITSLLMYLFGYTGYVYLIIMTGVGLFWFGYGASGLTRSDDVRWAKKMFGISLLCLLTFSVLLGVNAFLL